MSAQTFTGKINPFPEAKSKMQNTLNILAVMVEFKPDQDNATFGDGTFGSIYSADYGNTILDPLPHDQSYFEDHLLFAKNYFGRESNGGLSIEYNVLPDIVTVSKTMRDYSPPRGEENNFSLIAEFSKEVWNKVDQTAPVDFSAYDMFVIFHAGVGRDVQLPGSIGNERDIPSLYLSLNAFKNVYGEDFQGFPVNDGSFAVTNSAILPSTESRELSGIGGKILMQLSTNGLIVSTIASHLGLPDLFDTETGKSAIGRFGLMDGQSIFAYAGIFPPGLSAWERIYLGWEEPVVVSGGSGLINIASRLSAGSGDTTLIKIPINAKEYFLIENRKRDAGLNGCTVTYKVGGEIFSKTFYNDEDEFNFYNVSEIKGVVLEVDDFDWAIPGDDRNTADRENFEDVGFIIWHIDENIIEEKLSQNKINTNKFLRGVRVVEADGIFDIGEEFQTIFGDIVIGEGTKEDTWYKTNPSELYRNIFNDNSKPSAKSNYGSNSLIEIHDISGISNKMSFRIKFGTDRLFLQNVFKFDSDKPLEYSDVIISEDNFRLILSNGKRYIIYDENGGTISTNDLLQSVKPLTVMYNNRLYYITAYNEELIVEEHFNGIKNNIRIPSTSKFSTPAVLISASEEIKFYIGTENGEILNYSISTGTSLNLTLENSTKIFDEAVNTIATDGVFTSAIGGKSYWNNNNTSLHFSEECKNLALTKDKNGEYISVVLAASNQFFTVKGSSILSRFRSNAGLDISDFSLGDIKGDGSNYIIVNDGVNVSAYNITGGLADNFPIYEFTSGSFVNQPLAADLSGNNTADVIAFSGMGMISAYSGADGKLINNFPVSIGGGMIDASYLFNFNSTKLLSVNQFNQVYLWNVNDTESKIYWANKFGNAGNNRFTPAPSSENFLPDYFPKSKAYNYPNPVYESETFIRFYVAEDSQAEVNIFDLSGDFVEKLNLKAAGGFDNEIKWDVSSIESGVYFAHLNVKSGSGRSDKKIIKIAVIK